METDGSLYSTSDAEEEEIELTLFYVVNVKQPDSEDYASYGNYANYVTFNNRSVSTMFTYVPLRFSLLVYFIFRWTVGKPN
ncbi:hypothetical protein T05_10714 [Trichinella murrelli]|uniref:Uncharacterized protein n=1 Tax=Trichinella murrelli TaxID=144512 RepID=A0A0V0U0N1_9BILA|nr:hypothetical protein T05_10714 [Trichinella murrelli]